MSPILSIIIPCYNSVTTFGETMQSVFDQELDNWEAIIINDGSPDDIEQEVQSWLEKDSRVRYFKKENGGLGSARNFGIKQAKGLFILPLDSDNKVKPNFSKKAIEVLQTNPSIGVVHGHAEYFGEKSGIWHVHPFDSYKMLADNYIDACAIIRKDLFDTLGLYDQNMPFQGHEDWEFWIRTIGSNYKFHRMDQVCFDYRVTGGSMIRTFDDNMTQANIAYIIKKHWRLYYSHYTDLNAKYHSLKKVMNESRLLKLSKITRFFKKK